MTTDLEQVLERSDELARADRHQENLALLTDALGQHPDEPEVALRAAAAYHGEDDGQTERHARHAVALAPEDPIVLTRAGFMSSTSGSPIRRSSGRATLRNALTLTFPWCSIWCISEERSLWRATSPRWLSAYCGWPSRTSPKPLAMGGTWRHCWRPRAVTRRHWK